MYVKIPHSACARKFLSVFMDSCACARKFLSIFYGVLCFRLRFQCSMGSCARACVSVWTLVLASAFLSVCMDLLLAFAFRNVCMESCACAFVALKGEYSWIFVKWYVI